VAALLPIAAFDPAEVALPDDEIVRFAQDALAVLRSVLTATDRALADSQRHLDAHDATASATGRAEALGAAAKALLGEDFVIVPRFSLGTALADEYVRAYDLSTSGTIFTHLAVDFPVDTWLHGVARVREKVGLWERVSALSEAFGRSEAELTAMQLPARPDEAWMGLEFPNDQSRDADRLLYTAHLATEFDPADQQCGLLLDEWTEHIPNDDVDSAVAFHFDRPNNEAPQAMLLVTPTAFTGSWAWPDVVDALNETLDLAKLRAVEPAHVDRLAYSAFLPATVMATQARQLTISANLGLNNMITFDPEA
jgi:hypothetical protein